MILDFHTHHLNAPDAIINVAPRDFAPQPGLHYSVGIHPWTTAEPITEDEWQLLEQAAHHPQVVAIGETGLDTLRGADLATQAAVFSRHIAVAERVGKPLVIHMVRTAQQVLSAWQKSQKSVAWMVHGFRGNAPTAAMLLRAGFYLSYGEHFNEQAVAATPQGRLLTETDESQLPIAEIHARIARAKQIPLADLLLHLPQPHNLTAGQTR